MEAVKITFSQAPMTLHRAVVCDECGALVVDWEQDRNGWTAATPNRDKHVLWHSRQGA